MKSQIEKEVLNGNPGALKKLQVGQRASAETTKRTTVGNLWGIGEKESVIIIPSLTKSKKEVHSTSSK